MIQEAAHLHWPLLGETGRKQERMHPSSDISDPSFPVRFVLCPQGLSLQTHPCGSPSIPAPALVLFDSCIPLG